MEFAQMLFFAFFGSCLSEMMILRDVRNVSKKTRPDFKDPVYYFTIFVDLFIGIGLSVAYYITDNTIEPLEIIYVSSSAPYLIKKIKESKIKN